MAQTSSLMALIAETVRLKAEAGAMRGRCPAHPDSLESLYVREEVFCCFGCQVAGDATSWIMLRDRVGRAEATERLTAWREHRG